MKTIEIMGFDGKPKEILTLSERTRVFYEKFPRDRFSWRMEQIPMSETNPVLAAIQNANPEAVKEILKSAPSSAFRKTVHFRCTLHDNVLNLDLGSASAYGEFQEYKDLERIESAAFSRMIALVAGIGVEDQDLLAQADAMLATQGSPKPKEDPKAQVRDGFSVTDTNKPKKETKPKKEDQAGDMETQLGESQSAEPTEAPKIAAQAASVGPETGFEEPEQEQTADSPATVDESVFFLLGQEAPKAAAIAAEFGLDADRLAQYLGSDSVKLRRLDKEAKKVANGSLTREQFVAMVNELCD